MQRRLMVSFGVVAVGLLAARPAAADHEDLILWGAAALIAPAHVGADLPRGGDGPTRVVVGWSYQLPVDLRKLDVSDWDWPHRVVFGGDLLFRGGTGARGRVGYRYATQRVFAGAGVSVSGAGVTFSPELAIKFGRFDLPPSIHLLMRGEIAANFQRAPAVTFLLGWSLL